MSWRTVLHRIWYELVRHTAKLYFWIFFRLRVYGREQIPRGACIVLSNHQSHFDPPLIGMMIPGQVAYLARKSLFEHWLVRPLIRSLNAIPVDRDGLGLDGLKETLRRLKNGQKVAIFPEGTRSPNGELGEIKPGFSALAKRAKAPLVICAMDGAFQAWPRDRPRPHLTGRIVLYFGPPLLPDEIAELDPRALVAEVEKRIAACLVEARRLRDGNRKAVESTLPGASIPSTMSSTTASTPAPAPDPVPPAARELPPPTV